MITKEQAWAVRGDEKKIELDRTQYPFRFTRRWFEQRNLVTWSTFFPKRFTGDPIKMIQIGVFEGMDLIWCLQNILKHPHSRVLAIDPWIKTTKLSQEIMDKVYDNAQHNLRPWRHQLQLTRCESFSVLQDVIANGIVIGDKLLKKGEFDLIVIDGDHNAPAVYDDAVASLELLKPGGWMVFDDVRNRIPKKRHVQMGLDMFMDDYAEQVSRVWYHYHCDCLEKIA
jgi:predicted O-methyltransferase YrrM